MKDEGGESAREAQRQQVMRQLVDQFQGDAARALHQFRLFAKQYHEREALPANVPESTAPIVLAAKNVTKRYKQGGQLIEVLKGVSIDIREGEIVAITGASGSGKSTLLQLIGGLDKPSDGEVYVGQTSLAKLSDKALSAFRLRTIGFVFQFFYLQPFLRLRQNLEVPGMFARTKRQVRRARIEELASRVGLGDRLTHFPRELSGGQIQRAAIARALLNNPKILLADEPTGNLDSKNGEAIIDLFETIRQEFGTTIVIVTHDSGIAARADRVIHLSDGRVV